MNDDMNREETVKALLAQERYGFSDLMTIMRLLRAPGGCPWDIEQTHESIRSCMIEEAYEVVEAIDTANSDLLREELGDVLFQVMFHSQIEAEVGRFTVDDVVHDICVKMIHRHPHVFASCAVSGTEDVLNRWERIKTEEKQRKTLSSRLRAVPPMLPALMRAEKIVKKSGAVEGDSFGALAQELHAQAEGLQAAAQAAESGLPADGAVAQDDAARIGALLWSVVRLSALLGVDAEQALGQMTESAIAAVEAQETLHP